MVPPPKDYGGNFLQVRMERLSTIAQRGMSWKESLELRASKTYPDNGYYLSNQIEAQNKTKPPSWLSVKQEARRRIRFTSVCTDRILASKRSKTRLKMPRKKKNTKWREVKLTSPRIPAKTAGKDHKMPRFFYSGQPVPLGLFIKGHSHKCHER
ncbi:uncharacterized protein LOC122962284 isoform X2 [Acropora millepora]|uniref:uncharacterized protein LOC122962284 isoform X2 n=1 Tax=Acropora millepora TaxID=45264 RepID=UPI001CF5A996|nr:uncharacterized protein LOC122962284 isoform X2 [Acropora millepora]